MTGDAFGLKKAIEGYQNITGLQKVPSADPLKPNSWTEVFAGVLAFMLEIAGILAIFAIVWSGYQYLTAYGNEEKAAAAKKTFIYALLGLVIALSALYLISILGALTA